MVDIHLGRHGVLLLLFVFLLLAFEDVLIWYQSGTLPALEFFVALVIVMISVAIAVREANLHPPPPGR